MPPHSLMLPPSSFTGGTLMATSVLCRRLRSLPGWRNSLRQAQHVHTKPREEISDQEENKVSEHQDVSFRGGYRLHYNPSSYRRCTRNSAGSECQSDKDDEDERCFRAQAPPFWQQSNRYSVSCSRHLSSSNNTLLDLAFNKASESRTPSALSSNSEPVAPDVKVDPRAFLKCRPEYASLSLDLTQRPDPVEWVDVLPLLQKVSVLRDRMKPSDVSRLLVELSKLHPDRMPLLRSDHRFSMLLQYSVEHLGVFSELQLLEVLQSFVWLEIPSSHSMLEEYEAELLRRANQLTLHQLLLAADLWRCIGKRVPQFLQRFYVSAHHHVGQLGVPELVHLLYIIGEGRDCPKDLIRPVEQLLMRYLAQLYPEEVGTVCLGLFKSQTSLSEGAVTRIVDKALSFVTDMGDFAMVNVLKYMRFSYLYHKTWLEAMAQEVPRRAPQMGVPSLMHVTLTCSALHYRNVSILASVAERVPALVPHCRSKDSSKLLWGFGTLGFLPAQCPGFYPSLTEAMRQRKAEFHRFPEHLLTGLLGLAFVSEFPEDLVALALSPEFVDLALRNSKLELKKDLFTLDAAVALELPQWKGPRLGSELREEVAEMLWKFAQSEVCLKPEVLEAESALQDLLGGDKFVCKKMILPHTRSIDLEVHLDSNGQPVPVDLLCPKQSPTVIPSLQSWEKMNLGVTITDKLLAQLLKGKNSTDSLDSSVRVTATPRQRLPPDEGGRLFDSVLDLTNDMIETLTKPSRRGSTHQDPSHQGPIKLAVQISSRNHYCIHSQQLLGLHAMKRRHLKMAGYRVVELGHQEWSLTLRKSRAEKLSYLHCKIYDSL
ncbi:FAST kinase domain-containing protein 5, mitochondrial isoform X1 [Fundulus heteroclitus]|uniref:FAST kinase domain-containing protein 5, mitochondrial isoform X1 n=2 Tax=Fundulus heteroclitus TaxID=8078 RepID=UPI00165AC872|nr:FAST kinase domain-containing protein 5, mitochondrial isoform X1 [Fundulus heteroclitus]XP_035995131.1 FAST kinase domain-containing protein 5, mitochondrial isoform X1 [Fundulus heteroclitus]